MAVLFLILGSATIAYGFLLLLTGDKGWRQIEANTADGLTCAEDFVLTYNVGASGASAPAESRALTSLYSRAARKAYQLFTPYEGFDDLCNLYAINRHPNEVLEVDPALYAAFALMEDYGRREHYLGPLYASYDDIFLSVDDAYARELDPWKSADAAAYYGQLAAYASDPDAIHLELLGNNQLRLKISAEYLRFAEENGIESFLDFFWLKNAFIADFLADSLLAEGYTLGTLSSTDGYSRSLTRGDVSYALNIYDLVDAAAYPAAVMEYSRPLSAVYLHSYPMNSLDDLRYYRYQDGEIRTSFVDLTDGKDRTAVNDLVVYSESASCAELLLKLLPLYVAESLNTEGLTALAAENMYAVWCESRAICYTDPDISLTNILSGDTVSYTTRLVK